MHFFATPPPAPRLPPSPCILSSLPFPPWSSRALAIQPCDVVSHQSSAISIAVTIAVTNIIRVSLIAGKKHPNVFRGLEDAYRPGQGAVCGARSAASGRTHESPGSSCRAVARGTCSKTCDARLCDAPVSSVLKSQCCIWLEPISCCRFPPLFDMACSHHCAVVLLVVVPT